jgi:hypothetical protein
LSGSYNHHGLLFWKTLLLEIAPNMDFWRPPSRLTEIPF